MRTTANKDHGYKRPVQRNCEFIHLIKCVLINVMHKNLFKPFLTQPYLFSVIRGFPILSSCQQTIHTLLPPFLCCLLLIQSLCPSSLHFPLFFPVGLVARRVEDNLTTQGSIPGRSCGSRHAIHSDTLLAPKMFPPLLKHPIKTI